MSKTFDPEHAAVLDSPEREERLHPDELVKSLGVAPGWTCIDLGCGTGFFTVPLARLVGEKGLVYAVDFSKEMLDYLRAKNPPANVRLHLAAATDTRLSSGIADLCFTAFVPHEFDDPGLLLTEAYRLLKAGGKIALLEWQARETGYGPPLAYRISLEEAMKLLEEAGFIDIQVLMDKYEHYLISGLKGSSAAKL